MVPEMDGVGTIGKERKTHHPTAQASRPFNCIDGPSAVVWLVVLIKRHDFPSPLTRMPLGKGDAGQVLRPFDVPDPRRSPGGQRLKSFKMSSGGSPRLDGAVGFRDDIRRIADQNELRQAERAREFQRVQQGEPLGIHARALSGVRNDDRLPGSNDRDLHGSGVGAATAVEEDLYAPIPDAGVHGREKGMERTSRLVGGPAA
jgi:hypothetical protein